MKKYRVFRPADVCLLPLFVALTLAGCGKAKNATTDASNESRDAAIAEQHREELLGYAVDNLNRLYEFESADAVRQLMRQIDPRNQPAGDEKQKDTLLATWPEPEMLRQIVNRLNQWIRTQPAGKWKADPMLTQLAKPLADLPQVKDLGEMEFSRFDGYALQEALWMRDAGRWAQGDALDDLDRAKNLFDWTVRNIQIEPDHRDRIPLFPWETLFFGRGTADERAWVFILLCRQMGIEAAVIEGGEGMLVAALIEGKAYLFDPLLGVPIPAKNGISRDSADRLTIQPATLDEAAEDEKVLLAMDADPKHTYALKAKQLDRATVMIEGAPAYLSQRMKLLESRLAGPQKMVLSASPTDQAEHWKKLKHVGRTRLWTRPYATLERRSHLNRKDVQLRLSAMLPFYAQPAAPLCLGRKLHIAGKLSGDDGAIRYYQLARPSQEELKSSEAHPLEKLFHQRAKQDASYWLGLIAAHRGNTASAVDYFTKRTLLFDPNGPWTIGAKYNLAQTYEAAGDIDRAVLQYQNNDGSPGYLGDLLRAKWLKTKNSGAPVERTP